MTTSLDQFVASARGRPGLWRLPVGLVIILAVWLLCTVLVMLTVVLFNLASGMDKQHAVAAMRALIMSHTPAGVVLTLLTFAGIWPGTWAALRLLHNQDIRTLFAPRGRMRWREFGGGLALAAAFWCVSLAVGLAVVGVPQRSALPVTLWLASLSPLAVLVFLQASGEELIFRGYILQQLGARFRSPLVWAFLPSFLFGMLHYSGGTELGIGWHYVAVTTLFGITAAAMVWRTGSLALAMGVHTGMNMLSLSLAGVRGLVDGALLYSYPKSDAAMLFVTDGAATTLLLIFVLSPWFPFGRTVSD